MFHTEPSLHHRRDAPGEICSLSGVLNAYEHGQQANRTLPKPKFLAVAPHSCLASRLRATGLQTKIAAPDTLMDIFVYDWHYRIQ